ncbi:MAG TPA: hypothetical protein VNO21_19215 [Polyangiaceae bacterium]|nr:hypothetical protein [Polyangiaceae bacterium]
MTERIGLIVGYEDTFPPAFIAKVNETPGFHAEIAKFGGISERYQSPYRVLVDRMSHEVPFYRFLLKEAMLSGTYVINDPFWWSADDKHFGFSLANKIGVAVPRTVMLPSRGYAASVDPSRSLRNLEYPLDWEQIADYVKFPAILKPADGGGWKNVSRVNDMDELLRDYNESNQLVMTLQEFIEFDEYVRCLCIGKNFILPIKYDPRNRCYVDVENFLPKPLEQQILDGAWALNHALGYDMNSVEFACKDGVPYAIDFTNPAPDMCVRAILPRNFHKVVDEMARFTIACAREGRTNAKVHAFQRYVDRPVPRA